MFKINEGMLDRIVRSVVGAVLHAMEIFYPDATRRYWTLIGIVPLVTGLVGFCPLYAMLGVSTCPAKRA